MSSEIRLTPTSYIVLGLIEGGGEATPYDLKQAVAASLGDFWTLQHAQLYTEPERLAGAGYLKERREEGGRRRRHYSTSPCSRSSSGPTRRRWRRPSCPRTNGSSPPTKSFGATSER
jgi:DNA-binding PadR family transcriptional regulator